MIVMRENLNVRQTQPGLETGATKEQGSGNRVQGTRD
jgi:hypothetical protein